MNLAPLNSRNFQPLRVLPNFFQKYQFLFQIYSSLSRSSIKIHIIYLHAISTLLYSTLYTINEPSFWKFVNRQHPQLQYFSHFINYHFPTFSLPFIISRDIASTSPIYIRITTK
ncbi:hypothetical protein CAAN1_07S00606 [[Candida] anglica]|uniref:Uncharacterized protein n=1 Tax=[Candida] anglica TaxID=148631 RepID=A0ABP0EBD3_9ASCO